MVVIKKRDCVNKNKKGQSKLLNYFKDCFIFIRKKICLILLFSIVLFFIDYLNLISKSLNITLTHTHYNMIFLSIVLLAIVYIVTHKISYNIIQKKINIVDEILIELLIVSVIYSILNRCVFYRSNQINFILIIICISILVIRCLAIFFSKDIERKNTTISCLDLYENNISNNIDTIIISDEPIISERSDLLDVKETINSVYNFCLNVKVQKSTTLGLIGEWGSGKTSIVNLVMEKIKNENHVKIMFFNPWQYTSIESMFIGLYTDIANALRRSVNDIELRHYFSEYKKIIFNKVGSLLDISYSYTTNSSIANVKKDINEVISSSGEELIIVIDNFDRISPKEIKFLNNAINNLIDFENVKYIICYDEKNINRISNQADNHLLDSLDKVINAKVFVPSLDRISFNTLFSKLVTNLVNFYNISIDDYMSVDFNNVVDIISNDIKNIRDCIRFINSLSINIITCIDLKLYLPDFLALEYVKYDNSQLYKDIYNNINVFLKDVNYSENEIKDILNKNNASRYIESLILKELFPNHPFNSNPVQYRCNSSETVYSYFGNKQNDYTRLNLQIDNMINDFNLGIDITSNLSEIISGKNNVYDAVRILGFKLKRINDIYAFTDVLLDLPLVTPELILKSLELNPDKSLQYIDNKFNNYESISNLFNLLDYYKNNGWGLEKIKNKLEKMLKDISNKVVKNKVDLLEEKYNLYSYFKVAQYVEEGVFKEYVNSIISNKNVMRMLTSMMLVSTHEIAFDLEKNSTIVDIKALKEKLDEIDIRKLNALEKKVYKAYKEGSCKLTSEEINNLRNVRYKDFSRKKV